MVFTKAAFENAIVERLSDTLSPCLMSGELSVADLGNAK